MNTKTIMTLAVAGALATAAFADEAFDNLVKLANTNQIIAANVEQVLDASVAVTNNTAFIKAVEAKLISPTDVIAKLKGKPEFFHAKYKVAVKDGSDADKIEAFRDFVDCWLAIEDEEAQFHAIEYFTLYCMQNYEKRKFLSLISKQAVIDACAKVVASSSKNKWNALANMVYIYGKVYGDEGNMNDLREQYIDQVVSAIKADEFKASFKLFDILSYLNNFSGIISPVSKELVNDIKWFKPYVASKKLPLLYTTNKNWEPEMTSLRKQFLALEDVSDANLFRVAKTQDYIDQNKNTTISIFGKLKTGAVKVDVALYLNDAGKLIEGLAEVDNSLEPAKLEKAIAVINGLDPDFEPAKVLKALRVINKKYTLKLYDDRDTWEPILSKVRALIDTYNN